MAAVQYDDVLKKIKSGSFDRLYYFYGKDIMSVEKLTRFLISETDESGFQKFTGDDFNISSFADYIQMFPMSADYNVIAVNDLNAENLPADDLKYLLETLEYIPETTVVIFYITGFDVKAGKKFPSPKNKKIIDFVSKHGVLCEMELKSVPELASVIIKSAQKQGCRIDRRNAEKIVQLCLCNSMMIKNETDKLCSYADGKDITSDMIDALVPQQLDSTVFNLAKAVAAFNLKRAVVLLDEVFLQQNDAVSVIAALSGTFIDFYRAKAALSCGRSEADVINDFNYKGREFVVRNSFRDCRRMSESHLKKCLDILADADKTIKSFSCSPRLITEQAVVKMTVREI